MTQRAKLLPGVAIGLLTLLSISACEARTARATLGSAAVDGPQAGSARGTTDMSGMPGMDHSAMAGMDHSGMAGMDHSSTPGMASAPRAAASGRTMDHSAMAGMDHSTMPGMDHSSMSGMGNTPATTATPGLMEPSAMAGMDHSGMAGMAGMSATPPTGTALAASSPANGAMVQGSPGAISLTLPQPMTLQSVSLSNAVGQRIPLSAALPDGPVETFRSPTPPLPAGNYTVAWTAGTGARTVNGTFAFMVH